MRNFIVYLLAVFGFTVLAPTVEQVTPAHASLVTPCRGRFLGPTFSPNGGYAFCEGGGNQLVNSINVLLKCQGDTSWRVGPPVYFMGQSSVLYCPSGKLAVQVSVALH